MTYKGLLKELALRTGCSKDHCKFIMDNFVEISTQALMEDEDVYVNNLFVLEPYELSARKARNPKTGEVTLFPSVKTVKCRFSKKIKKMLKYGEDNDEEDF